MSSTLSNPPSISRAPWRHHRADAVALWSQHLGGPERAELKVAHAYLDNPAGEGQCLLAQDGSPPQSIGALGLHARRYWRGCDAADFHILADFVVDPRQRTLGPALALMRAAIDTTRQQALGLFGWPNERSAAVARRAALPPLLAMRRYVKPLRSRLPLMRLHQAPRATQGGWSELPHKAYASMLPALLPVVTPVLDAALSAHDQLQLLGGRASAALRHEGPGSGWHAAHRGAWHHVGGFADTPPGNRRAQDNPTACQAVDTLWARRCTSWWLSERSWPVLCWRFAHGQWQLSVWLDTAGQAQGYVVWRTAPAAGLAAPQAGRSGDEVVEIADVLCNTLAQSLAPMLRSFGHSMRRQTRAQLLSLEFGGCTALARQILDAGFLARGRPAPVLGMPPPAAVHDSWHPDDLFLTSLDRDPDL